MVLFLLINSYKNLEFKCKLENRKNKQKTSKILNENLTSEINVLIYKIDKSISEFKFNVSIAHFYEAYSVFNKYIEKDLDNKCLIENIINIMKLMVPFTLT